MEPASLSKSRDRAALERDGALHFPGAFDDPGIAALQSCVAPLPDGRPGARLLPGTALRPLLAPADRIASAFLGPAARPVRALLLDKGPERNWALGWHQDRTIALRERIDVPGFADWTVKSGIAHAVPPFALLERMLTLRIHLDRAGPDNGPLLIVPGSHRLGPIAEPELEGVVERLGSFACLAEAGDVWLFSAPILHASARSLEPAGRRVLQLSYSADRLPGGLEWLGV
jgi:hypothetical protein